MQLQTYFYWYSLHKAVLELADFLGWKLTYGGYQAEESQAWTNLRINIPVTLDMLTEQGTFVHPVHQAQIGHQAYYQLFSDLAFKALKACTHKTLQLISTILLTS